MTEIFLFMIFIALLFLTMMRFNQAVVMSVMLIGLLALLIQKTFFLYVSGGVLLIEWFAILFTFLSMLLTFENVAKGDHAMQPWMMMVIASLIGVCMIIKSDHFLSIYVGFELMSLPMVVMMCIDRFKPKSHVAAWRYFILTTCGSSLWLLGMVLLYGLTGEMSLSAAGSIMKVGHYPLMNDGQSFIWVVVIMTLLLSGFTVKLGLFPMQRWVFDVYRYVPLESLTWLTTVPKLAVWVLLIKTFSVFYGYQNMILWLCMPIVIISIVYGSIMAISQRTIRGLLAYSSVAQMGFVMVGCALTNAHAWTASTFFLIVYMVLSLMMFGLMMRLHRHHDEVIYWSDLNGLYGAYPAAAWLIFIVMFALAGVPPFLGFITKFAVMMAMVKQGLWTFALVVMLVSVVAAFYYLRLVREVYFTLNDHSEVGVFSFTGRLAKMVMLMMTLGVLVIGIYPNLLLGLLSGWL